MTTPLVQQWLIRAASYAEQAITRTAGERAELWTRSETLKACANELSAEALAGGEGDYMCPNCNTPWKCNGPHIPQSQTFWKSPDGRIVSEADVRFDGIDTTGWAEVDTPPRAVGVEVGDGWISVSDTKPEEDVPVWCVDADGNVWIGAFVDVGEGWAWVNCYNSWSHSDGKWSAYDHEWDDDYQPTHWKTLPVVDTALHGAGARGGATNEEVK